MALRESDDWDMLDMNEALLYSDRWHNPGQVYGVPDLSSGRSPDRHQASRELCREEGRTNDAHLCDSKSARRNCLKNKGKPYQIKPK